MEAGVPGRTKHVPRPVVEELKEEPGRVTILDHQEGEGCVRVLVLQPGNAMHIHVL